MLFKTQFSESVLFITLDSCRYDTFLAAHAPNLKAIGPLYKTMASGNFTYASHMAMFMGFTPGDARRKEVGVNPKFGKIFRMSHGGIAGKAQEHYLLEGHNIIDGFNVLGYRTLGTGAVAWFNPQTQTAGNLISDFDEFYYPGNSWSLPQQLHWLAEKTEDASEPVFAFLNLGETHVPYYYQGADWTPDYNPCVPFAHNNDAEMARYRQKKALEYVDGQLAEILEAFSASTILVCADHGDCWGEDGLWEHGISHPKVLEVPLLFRLAK